MQREYNVSDYIILIEGKHVNVDRGIAKRELRVVHVQTKSKRNGGSLRSIGHFTGFEMSPGGGSRRRGEKKEVVLVVVVRFLCWLAVCHGIYLLAFIDDCSSLSWLLAPLHQLPEMYAVLPKQERDKERKANGNKVNRASSQTSSLSRCYLLPTSPLVWFASVVLRSAADSTDRINHDDADSLHAKKKVREREWWGLLPALYGVDRFICFHSDWEKKTKRSGRTTAGDQTVGPTSMHAVHEPPTDIHERFHVICL